MIAPLIQQENAIQNLEQLVTSFAAELSAGLDAANQAGVSQAVLLPRLFAAFRASFGSDVPLPMIPGMPQ